ncbi:MAG: substrate-binding domain-containing protein [Planctomycetes bacterium]|nr:substrate-binding domain-containing protein [Planctomycetota bacterium]
MFTASCRQNTDDANKPKKSVKGTVGVSVLTMTNPFFKEIADVLTAELAKDGYEVIAVSGDHDVPKQRKQVQDFLVQKVSAIVLCPCDSRAIGAVIKEANQAGVPVFTADIGCLDPDAKVVTHVATDNYQGGKQAGEAMIEALGETGGNVLVLDYQKVESCILRIKGFDEVLAKHNAGRTAGKINVVKRLPCDGDKDKSYKATQDTLESNPDIVGIFAINDPAALGARAALEKATKAERIKIIGFDGQPEGKQAIRDGKIYADPIQFPDKIAQETARAIVRHFQGDPLGKEILIPTRLYRQADGRKDATLK